jgi:hypothetical protein
LRRIAAGHPLAEVRERRVELGLRSHACPQGPLRAEGPPAPAALQRRRLAAAGDRVQVAPGGPAEHRHEVGLAARRHRADGPQVVGVEAAGRRRPHPPQPLDGQRVQERLLALGRHEDAAVGLGGAAGHLRQDLRAGDADAQGEAELLPDLAAQPAGHLGGMEGFPRDVEEGLLHRPGLDHRGPALEDREQRPARGDVGLPPRLHDDGAGTARARQRGPHPTVDPVGPGLVARGHDDPGPDEHGPPAQPWLLTLRHGGEEGVHVGMEDRGRHPVRTYVRMPRGRIAPPVTTAGSRAGLGQRRSGRRHAPGEARQAVVGHGRPRVTENEPGSTVALAENPVPVRR